jgi:copper transport protein
MTTHRYRSSATRFGLAGALAIALVMRVFTIAWAHATLVSSEPSAGTTVASVPSRIRLVFSEPVEPGMAKVSVVATGGRTVTLAAAGDPRDVHAIIAAAGDAATLPAGEVRVVWHVVSADGHPVSGSFVFSVGAPALPGAVPPPEPSSAPEATVWGPAVAGAPLIPAILRGVGIGCLLALCGLLSFTALSGESSGRESRVALGLSIATPLFLGMHMLAWMMNASAEHRLDSAWLAASFASTVGRVELWRTGLSLLPLWAFALARRPRLALALTIPPLLVSAGVGHSAAIHPLWAVPLKAIHLAALALWMGGLLWIVVRDHDETHSAAAGIARVSTLALWAVVLVTASGIGQALLLIGSMAGLRSPYGAVLVAKVVGMGILLAFGFYHRSRLVPAIAARGLALIATLRASVARELMVFCFVILLGAFLAYVSPTQSGDAHASSHSSEALP